jgi:hypothetical protein
MSNVPKNMQPPWRLTFFTMLALGIAVGRLLFLNAHPSVARPDAIEEFALGTTVVLLIVTIVIAVLRTLRWRKAGYPE